MSTKEKASIISPEQEYLDNLKVRIKFKYNSVQNFADILNQAGFGTNRSYLCNFLNGKKPNSWTGNMIETVIGNTAFLDFTTEQYQEFIFKNNLDCWDEAELNAKLKILLAQNNNPQNRLIKTGPKKGGLKLGVGSHFVDVVYFRTLLGCSTRCGLSRLFCENSTKNQPSSAIKYLFACDQYSKGHTDLEFMVHNDIIQDYQAVLIQKINQLRIQSSNTYGISKATALAGLWKNRMYPENLTQRFCTASGIKAILLGGFDKNSPEAQEFGEFIRFLHNS